MPSVVTELYRIWYKIHTSFFAVHSSMFYETFIHMLWLIIMVGTRMVLMNH